MVIYGLVCYVGCVMKPWWRRWLFWILLGGLGVFQPVIGLALGPDEILVVANRNVAGSVRLARYYMQKRQIPGANLLQLRMTDKERCSREEYERNMVVPVRRYLRKHDGAQRMRCIVTVYGVPLEISAPAVKAGAEKKYDDGGGDRRGELVGEHAALDSELALVETGDYSLSGWVPNPLFLGNKDRKLPISGERVLMVSRLDGPRPEIVRRIIDDSVAAEKRGLAGNAYFDARWPRPDGAKKLTAYEVYDRSIHLAADQLRAWGRMTVVLDEGAGLFQKGQCPGAALYCGWYSLGKYVDAFDWVRGAVGHHIASSECSTLREAGSQVWCKRMLEEGVAATIGPTSEPYVQAFPAPELFFRLIVDGRLGLVECYFVATPFLSWQMVLIGDPLYRPFGG
jgi:uncharacterized protein (TIGR03790 family)